jgi:uncharacterized protein YndB with AHSA1/START domain
VNFRAIGAILGLLLPIAARAEAAWVADQTVQQQLDDGKVAVRIQFDGDQSRIHVQAAVKINASPETIWRVLTDCDHASSFIPGVKHCRRVQSAPDDSWEIIEHEAKYSWLMPAVTSVIRAEYKRPERIDFQRISGDLKQEEGDWVLEPASPADATSGGGSEADADPATIVEYDLHVDPGFWVPRVLLRHSLRSELPAALTALRQRAESTVAKR